MSIKNLFEKIGVKNDQNENDISLVQHKNLSAALGEESTQARDGHLGRTQKYSENECLLQLEVVKSFIEGFDEFVTAMNQPIESALD